MLRIANLTKSFPAEGRRRRGRSGVQDSKVFAVNDVSFEVGEGELFTLLGPSGCGKTTTLRSIAGLERPDAGEISLGERMLFRSRPGGTGRSINLPANDRGLGMVFQSYAIWPHMSVFDNVAYPLQVQRTRPKPGKKQIAERVSRILEVMELAPYRDRSATKLSGGQQQRLALARALVTEPSLMLLDEPLSNLDAKLRESLRFELKRLQRDLGLTSLYVTHDQAEALALSSRIAVMRSGSVVQLGTPREIYTTPNSQFVAEFIGTSNFISGVAQGSDGDTLLVDTVEGRLVLHGVGGQPAGSEVIVSVRPEAIEIGTESLSAAALNEWRGEVVTRSFLGDAVDHIVKVGKYEMRVRCNPSVSIPQGTNVYVWLNPEKLSLVPLAQ